MKTRERGLGLVSLILGSAMVVALGAVLHSMGIELLAGIGILTTWIIGLLTLGPVS